jgi:SAM-dependent methyltransferase
MTAAPRESVLSLPPAARDDALALDVACGQGRHAASLSRAGYHVVAMDVSMSGLQHTREVLLDSRQALVDSREAHTRSFLVVQADVDAWPFAPATFDLVIQVDFLDRRIFALLRESLRPGGLLLIDTFLDQGRKNAEGPSRSDFLLVISELPGVFGDFDVLRYEEVRGDTARAVFLGRKA